MTSVIVVTVLVGGLPAIGLAWMQMETQVRSRVLDALSSTQALYAAEKRNLLQVARLVSERPTLCDMLRRRDANLTAYLEELRLNTHADALMAFAGEGQVFMSGPIDLPLPEVFFEGWQPPVADFIALDSPPRLAILAISEVVSANGCEKGHSGRVIATQILDDDFMRLLTETTGLEQSLIIGDRRVASSLANVMDWPLNPEAASLVSRAREACCTIESGDSENYYVGLATLVDRRGGVVALSEVALPANAIRRGVWNAITLLVGIGVLVALGSTGLAFLLTGRIIRPLRALSEAAERMGSGDLETPVPLTSGWLAIDTLANQLDHARRNLQQIQQITRQEIRRIEHLLGATQEGIITFDEGGIVTWANSDALRILGYDMSHLLRKHYSQIFRPAPGAVAALSDIMQPLPDRPLPNRITILDAHLHPITLSVCISSSETEDGTTGSPQTRYVLILRDVSEEQAIHRLRSEFLANVAHEFRTPLSAISASTELLVDEGSDMPPEDVALVTQSVRLSVAHLQTLVNNLLESAIIEAGVFRLRIRLLQLDDLLKNLAEMMLPLLHRRQQRLEIEASRELPSSLWGDADRLSQALVNLVENASKFSPSGAAITLSVTQVWDALAFCVSDSGPGLPTGRFNGLFSRFFTGDRSRDARYGIGLGLPIVKAIAEAHGGNVGAENRPEGGARVWFTIPLRGQGGEGEGS